ncbi:MAG: protein arginine kinase [bacterium]|nr:protein arginine kinase [Candidatus Sumerlaeota bacterium]
MDNLRKSDEWLDRGGPDNNVVMSSRARYARNLPRIPFPMRARHEELKEVLDRVQRAIRNNPRFASPLSFSLTEIKSVERNYLKENHLISTEMEKGGENRMIILTDDIKLAVMINEEDHLRLFALDTGFQLCEVFNQAAALESELGRELGFAFSPKYGYLTACPTNTGTGLRASVMLHLPGLSYIKQISEIVKSMPQLGLTVRGFHGENSENQGDFFQISNEVTLGKSEEQIIDLLSRVIEQILDKEKQARRMLFEKNRAFIEDELWRAYGLLAHARLMTSHEALQLLSKLRLGIDRGYFGSFSHSDLNKLIIEVQPGHLQYSGGGTAKAEARDRLRADVLRKRLEIDVSRN